MDRLIRHQAIMQGKRFFRARHIKTSSWWEGIARSPNDAYKKASKELGVAFFDVFDLRELTVHGGWKKPKEVE